MDNAVILSADNHQSEKSMVVYRSSDGEVQLEVILYNETLWLDVHQMSQLFDRDETTVRKHINKALVEELSDEVVVANFATTTKHGAIAGKNQTHDVSFYNLYMIFSVGYRVKSQRGIDFRKWANMVLKNYVFSGYAVNNRLDRLEVKVYKLEEKTKEMETEIKGQLPPHEGIFYNGQIFDAYKFITDLIKKAKTEIVLIDNYVDETVLTMLDNRNPNVSATIYTSHISEKLDLALAKHNSQYQPINIERFNKSHDRFLIIDDDVYLIGGSIKDLGKKISTFVKLSIQKRGILGVIKTVLQIVFSGDTTDYAVISADDKVFVVAGFFFNHLALSDFQAIDDFVYNFIILFG